MQYTKRSTLATYAIGILLGSAFLFTTSCSNSGSSLGLDGTNDEMSDMSSIDYSRSTRSLDSNKSWKTSFSKSSVSSLPSTFWWSIKAVSGFHTKMATTFTKMLFGEDEYYFGSEIEMADQSEGPKVFRTAEEQKEDERVRLELVRKISDERVEKKRKESSGPVITQDEYGGFWGEAK